MADTSTLIRNLDCNIFNTIRNDDSNSRKASTIGTMKLWKTKTRDYSSLDKYHTPPKYKPLGNRANKSDKNQVSTRTRLKKKEQLSTSTVARILFFNNSKRIKYKCAGTYVNVKLVSP